MNYRLIISIVLIIITINPFNSLADENLSHDISVYHVEDNTKNNSRTDSSFMAVSSTDVNNYPEAQQQARFLFPIRKFFLGFNEFQGRGIKDFIGIVSTILAALLGAILVKLNALIVLSVISVGIGKLLLMITSFKLFHGLSHGKHSPSPSIIVTDRIRSAYQPAYYYQEEYDHHPPPVAPFWRHSEDTMHQYPHYHYK